MASRFHAARQRRAERAASLGESQINLVPLVDMLVSILFFSLLTYTGATASLVAFDLALPPVLVTEEDAGQAPPQDTLKLLVVVRIEPSRILVEHNEGFSRAIGGTDEASLEEFAQVMQQIKADYPENDNVTVVPSDATSYEDVIEVLERLRIARFPNIALGTQQRGVRQVAAAGGGR